MLSVVIPFYNEEKRLDSGKKLIDGIESILSLFKTESAPSSDDTVEFVLVDDGSLDNTVTILNRVKESLNDTSIKVLSYLPNRGKGYAVRQGVLNCNGDKIIVMDADFSIDITEIPRFDRELDSYDIVIGSKNLVQSHTDNLKGILRRYLGKSHTFITNAFLGIKFTDITCGFKAYRCQQAKKMFRMQLINRWSYESESLFVAKKLGYSVKEFSVKWSHIEGSKVNTLIDAGRSIRDLVIIRLNDQLGKYD